MQFDWRELLLWCFCAFFLGMCIGPILFLDADFLKWTATCAAVLGVAIAIGGFVLKSMAHRLQARLAEQAEFRRLWNLFGQGQTVRLDLKIAANEAQRVLDKLEQVERLQVAFLAIADREGANVNVEHDPYTHRIVAAVWELYRDNRNAASDPNLRDQFLTDGDVSHLKLCIKASDDAQEHLRTNYLDVLLPQLEQFGWRFELNDDGVYEPKTKGRQL